MSTESLFTKSSARSKAVLRGRMLSSKYNLSLRHALERWVLDGTSGIAESSNGPVVGPSSELFLHGLRQHRSIYI